jgi:putative MATE family efflux protein
VAVVGNGLNIALNVFLVYGLDLGIAGSAIGSVIAQVLSAAWLVVVVVRAAREQGAPLSPDRAGILAAAHAAVALVIRTLALRACLLVGTYAATRVESGSTEVNVATHQVAITLWTFLAFALDAIAIAAQALTGRALGSGDVEQTRRLTRRMTTWGWAGGLVLGAALAAAAPFIGALFTSDPAVREALVPVLLVAAVGQTLAGYVFVLDGVLIGAGDGAYLAWAGLVVLAAYAPAALVAATLPHGLVAVWVAMTVVFMGARGVLLGWRARGDHWLVTGATR